MHAWGSVAISRVLNHPSTPVKFCRYRTLRHVLATCAKLVAVVNDPLHESCKGGFILQGCEHGPHTRRNDHHAGPSWVPAQDGDGPYQAPEVPIRHGVWMAALGAHRTPMPLLRRPCPVTLGAGAGLMHERRVVVQVIEKLQSDASSVSSHSFW